MMSVDGFSTPTPPSQLKPVILDPVKNPNPTSSNTAKRRRNLPGNPDPDAEVIALSPKSLMATNRFVCEICSKGFQRDQNLQLHRRGHNLPWKLKQRNKLEVVRKKVYVCPEESCVHHEPSRALGDLTGVKKHFSRKHGEKKWKCEKCSKKYAVQSDWKAHNKICGTREYRCDCGTLFSRKDSFLTHRSFCDGLTEESSRMVSFPMQNTTNLNFQNDLMKMTDGSRTMNALFPDVYEMKPRLPIWPQHYPINSLENSTLNSMFLGSSGSNNNNGGILSSEMMQWPGRSQETLETYRELPQGLSLKQEEDNMKGRIQLNIPLYTFDGYPNLQPPQPRVSATSVLPTQSQMGSSRSTNSDGFDVMNTITDEVSGFSTLNQTRNEGGSNLNGMMNGDGLMMMMMAGLEQNPDEGNLTRDFLGVGGKEGSFSWQQELMKFTTSMKHSS